MMDSIPMYLAASLWTADALAYNLLHTISDRTADRGVCRLVIRPLELRCRGTTAK